MIITSAAFPIPFSPTTIIQSLTDSRERYDDTAASPQFTNIYLLSTAYTCPIPLTTRKSLPNTIAENSLTPWRLCCDNLAQCVPFCKRRHPPHFAPSRRPLVMLPPEEGRYPICKFLPADVLSWVRRSRFKVPEPEPPASAVYLVERERTDLRLSYILQGPIKQPSGQML